MLDQLIRLVINLTIFLAPAHFAYTLDWQPIMPFNREIDYLLLRIFAVDLTVICLAVVIVLKYRKFNAYTSSLLQYPWRTMVLASAFLVIFVSSLTSPLPLSSVVVFFRIAIYLLTIWIIIVNQLGSKILHWAKPGIILAIVFQISLGIYQLSTQQSLVGYELLGEPDLASPNISRSTVPSLYYILPYGSTAHPNVLSGMIGLYSLLLISITINNSYSKHIYILSLFYIVLSIFTMIITQSVGNIVAYLIALTYLATVIIHNQKNSVSRFRLQWLSILTCSLLIGILAYHSMYLIDIQSLERRYRSFMVTYEVLKTHSLSGTGLNASVIASLSADQNLSTYLFPQPIHNIYLHLATEIGFIPLTIIGWLAWLGFQSKKSSSRYTVAAAPLIYVLISGITDHYFLTLPGPFFAGLLAITLAISASQDNHLTDI